MSRLTRTNRRGDTLIEVALAIAIYAMVSTIALVMMNNGVASSQTNLEVTMARNEIDAQAEVLRFIHNSFLTERELSNNVYYDWREERTYEEIWRYLSRDVSSGDSALAMLPENLPSFNIDNCAEVYADSGEHSIFKTESPAFVVDTRKVDPSNPELTIVRSTGVGGKDIFTATDLYPRVIFQSLVDGGDSDTFQEGATYTNVARVEGLWVFAVRDYHTGYITDTPEYFDFHIRTCWFAPGRKLPTTIGTIIRLYNPEYVEAIR